MIYVALAALVVTVAAIASTGAIVRSLIRQHARERAQLLDQMCHLAGRTWTPPPSAEPREQPERDTYRNFEQMPDEWALES